MRDRYDQALILRQTLQIAHLKHRERRFYALSVLLIGAPLAWWLSDLANRSRFAWYSDAVWALVMAASAAAYLGLCFFLEKAQPPSKGDLDWISRRRWSEWDLRRIKRIYIRRKNY